MLFQFAHFLQLDQFWLNSLSWRLFPEWWLSQAETFGVPGVKKPENLNIWPVSSVLGCRATTVLVGVGRGQTTTRLLASPHSDPTQTFRTSLICVGSQRPRANALGYNQSSVPSILSLRNGDLDWFNMTEKGARHPSLLKISKSSGLFLTLWGFLGVNQNAKSLL